MRPLHSLAILLILFLSACEKAQPQPDEASAIAEMETIEEEMMGPDIMGTDQLPPVSAPNGERIVMDVVDDNANPLYVQRLLSSDEALGGWISLFDGKTLYGWKSNNPEVKWKVENDAITADVGPVGLLLTTVPFADFELLCEFKYEAGGNSGLFIRTSEDPVNLEEDCLEINIADEQPEGYLTGSIVKRAKTQAPVSPSTDWQSFRVTALGKRIIVELNHELVVDYLDENPDSRKMGYIGLQQRFGKVQFRKVNLKPLAMKSLFNGNDLAGWKVVPGSSAQFVVDREMIRVKGGPGFLETDKTYKDFIIQTSARTGTKDVNSGFFFRAQEGTDAAPSNGYEVQIHHGFNGSNRDQPTNSGSGAIFRRTDARRVVGNDLEWSTITLVAYGPHYSTWVDGYQVVDWVDDRKPDPNPRRGQRVEAGHISLQGHDPTTDVEFRMIRLNEYPELPAPKTPVEAPPAGN